MGLVTATPEEFAAAAVTRWRTAVGRRLLPWFARHARTLPWRATGADGRRDPYHVLVSELMLQQTRVEQARPYFERFIRRFPTLLHLARARQASVLKAWEGLGYYARARNLHRLAQAVTGSPGGGWPDTPEGLQALPGIGPYTAAAVGSLAFGWEVAAVDGNVIRVLSRLCARDLSRDRAGARRLAELLRPRGRAGAYNEAMMELGAMLCTPRRPGCGACPLHTVCEAFREGDPAAYPAPRKRVRVPHYLVGAAVTLNRRGEVLIARRREQDMLGGLWEFPGGKCEAGETLPECIARELREELGIEVDVGARLTVVRHAYSHFTIELHAHLCRLRRGRPRALACAGWAWVAPSALGRRAFSRADVRICEALQAWRHSAGAGGPER